MNDTATIILIGLRGSGKTTLGRALAEDLGRPFVDLDDVTARLLDETEPGAALRAHGEPAFRDAETRALRAVLDADGIVLALGGGTPTAPGARERLEEARRSGDAVIGYLRASAQTLRERLGASGIDRPSLTGADPLDEIGAVLAQRDGAYRELADVIFEMDGVDEARALTLLREWVGAG